MINSEQNMEMMLFDFLEGNLEKQKTADFESDLNLNPLLQSELTPWKATYVECDFYDTSALEKKIISKTAPFNFAFYLNMILILSMSFISSKLPNTDPLSTMTIESLSQIKTPIEVKKRTPIIIKEIAHIESPDFLKPNPNLKFIPIIAHIEGYKNNPYQNFSNIKSITLSQNTCFPMPLIQIKSTNESSSVETNNKARKRLKDQKSLKNIKKMRRRTAEKKKEPEFIKGNIPYVVPMNSQNF